MSLAAATRSPLASPALKHALNGGACYFSMAGASHLGVATSPGAARSPHAHLGSPHTHLGSPHFNTPAAAATSPGHMHLALPAGPPTGFTLRLPQRGGEESPGEGFTLRLPAEKRMTPRSPGLQRAPRGKVTMPTMSPRIAAMSPRAAAMSPRTLGTTDARAPETSQLQALAAAPAKDFTLTLPAPRRKARMQLDALEDATPTVAVKMARKETTATPKGKTASGGGGFVGLVRRTVRFVLPAPAPAPPKGASEFRSCRGRPPTPYPKKKKGGKSNSAKEAPDYFSHQV